MQLTQVADGETLRAAGARFVAGQGWLHFHAHAALWGVVLFGRPDRQETERLVRSLAVELDDEVPTHHSIVDCARLEGADAGAFEALSAYVQRERERLALKVSRLALVRPPGLPGAVIAGFFGVTPPPYPVELFADREAGLEWLGAHDAAGLGDALDAAIAALTGEGPLLGALRARVRERILDAELGPLDLEPVARALGVSDRTLQRRLQALGTTFQREVTTTRLAEVQHRLLDTDDPLTTIAVDLGFASPQHLSALFKKELGATPSDWRKQRRGR